MTEIHEHIEGYPHSADIVYEHVEREQITDFKFRIHPPCRLSKKFLETAIEPDSSSDIQEFASTPNFTLFEMEFDDRSAPEEVRRDPDERAAVGISIIEDIVQALNKSSDLSAHNF